MRIHSTLAILGSDIPFMLVMDTFANDRRFVTAIVESPDGGKSVSQLGQQVLDVAARYHQAQQHQAVGVHLVSVLAAQTVRERVVKALKTADAGALVVFFGASDSICAGLMRALGLTKLAGRGALPKH